MCFNNLYWEKESSNPFYSYKILSLSCTDTFFFLSFFTLSCACKPIVYLNSLRSFRFITTRPPRSPVSFQPMFLPSFIDGHFFLIRRQKQKFCFIYSFTGRRIFCQDFLGRILGVLMIGAIAQKTTSRFWVWSDKPKITSKDLSSIPAHF